MVESIQYCAECIQNHIAAISGLMDEALRLGGKDKSLDYLYERIPKILEHQAELYEFDLAPEVLEPLKEESRKYLEEFKSSLRSWRKHLSETNLSKGGGSWEAFEEACKNIREIRDQFYRYQPVILLSEGVCENCRIDPQISEQFSSQGNQKSEEFYEE